MPETFEETQHKILKELDKYDSSSEQCTTAIKNLKTLAEAQQILKPDPIPDPEPTGFRGFMHRNSGDLIKVGGTLTAIALIGIVETKFDVIFRSKASKYI